MLSKGNEGRRGKENRGPKTTENVFGTQKSFSFAHLSRTAEEDEEEDRQRHGEDINHPEPGPLLSCFNHLPHNSRLQDMTGGGFSL